ncbi:MAG: glycosyltransferase family 39 protein, partial [Dehalococcoidia bacterium]|nr:glycosyltransferase family 39 protein [Dehalococcoidia bacterium]
MRDSRAASLRFTLVVSAVLLALIAQVFIRYGGLHWAVAPLIVAVACLALESVRVRRRRSDAAPDKQLSLDLDALPAQWTLRIWNVEFTRSDLGWVSIITACLLMSVSLRNFGNERVESLSMAWYCFGAAVILLLVGIAVIDGRLAGVISRVKSNGGFRIELKSLVPWLILGVILILATGVRVYNLEDVPPGIWYDEADNLLHAQRYARDPGQIPVYEPSTNLPSLFLMPIAALVKLAGAAVTTPRLVAVAFGAAGIVVVFLLARHMFGVFAGLIAAFFAAFMRWDIIWSRIGMHGITSVLFAALTGWLTLRALRNGRYSDYAFAGVSLGLGMWFYSPFRMFPLVVGFMLIHHLAVNRPPIGRFALSVSLMILTSLFVAAPLTQFAMDDPGEFFKRAENASVFTITPREQWVDQINESLEEHLMMFNRKGDPNPRHNLPDEPMLDFFMAALFALGFFFAFTQWRNTALFTLPFWVLFMILPGVLTVPWESPQSLRSILVIPAVAALAAY